ncbi:MAG: DUF4136 domain-containing protein, partial [Gammaproteobacteria bacterium]
CAAALCLGLVVAGCAPMAAKVETDWDRAADYSAYRSFAFVEPMAIDQDGHPPAWGEAFRREIATLLESRGLELSEDPDLVIDVATNLSDQGESSLQNDAYQALHPQRGTFYEGWRGYGEGYGSTTRTSRVSTGRFDVGVFEADSRSLLFEGTASSRVDLGRSAAEVSELVAQLVSDLFADAPFRASP